MTDVLIGNGTPIVWADATDYNPAAGVIYTRTHQIDLTSLANNAARQGAKADLGATRAASYVVRFFPEVDVAVAAGVTFRIYFGFSNHATAGLDNPGMLTGADAAYAGATGGTIAGSVKQMDGPFSYVCEAANVGTILPMNIGILNPMQRYVSPVVWNDATGQALEGDAVEMYLALIPIVTSF